MTEVQTPDWVKDAVFYQIFPDRFAKSATLAKPGNLEPWDSLPTVRGYKGGDLLGVVEHLDHIQALGANAIYFCPIFRSACNHRYHTHDYYQVDPLLGGNDAFFALLQAAHARGMRVVLDGVFNHASRGFYYFNDILENGQASPYVDWFNVHEYPPNAYDETRPIGYEAWVGLPALPKLNTDNPQVREYLMQVAEHWLRLGIDGWRLDVAKEITTPGFWQEFRRRAKAINPEAYIVAEIWEIEAAQPHLRGDAFDAVMNYPFAEATLAFVAGPRVERQHWEGRAYNPGTPLDAPAYGARIEYLLGLYPWEIQLAQMNLLDSHDAARVVTLAGGDRASAHLATLLLLTYPGAVSVYYGDEIGLPGGLPDYETRRTMPWDKPETWDQAALDYHRALIALRHAHPALRRGTYRRLYAEGLVYVFERQLLGETVTVAVNAGEAAQAARFAARGLGERVYGEAQATAEGDWVGVRLPPRSGAVWARAA
jgi:cyclomaltodextrinase